jgi:hypothetical protein
MRPVLNLLKVTSFNPRAILPSGSRGYDVSTTSIHVAPACRGGLREDPAQARTPPASLRVSRRRMIGQVDMGRDLPGCAMLDGIPR